MVVRTDVSICGVVALNKVRIVYSPFSIANVSSTLLWNFNTLVLILYPIRRRFAAKQFSRLLIPHNLDVYPRSRR
jgi:hypothetical protein